METGGYLATRTVERLSLVHSGWRLVYQTSRCKNGRVVCNRPLGSSSVPFIIITKNNKKLLYAISSFHLKSFKMVLILFNKHLL